jgi:signal transduction histidine kinase
MRKLSQDYAFESAKHFACWTLVGLFFFSQDLVQSFHSKASLPWLALLECWLSRAYIWGLLAPAVLRLARRFRFDRTHLCRWLGLHVIFGVGIGAAGAILAAAVGLVLKIPWYMPNLRAAVPAGLAFSFHASFFTYWTILGLYETFDHYRSSRLEKQRAVQAEMDTTALKTRLAQAQLSALRAQLQPHFLFNTLNAIVTLIRRRRNAEAEEMAVRLGDLLRSAIEETDTHEIPLRKELKFLESYLEIERVRFKDRMSVEVDSSPGIMDALVPYMCLQPLAENAVRHGIARRSSPGTLTVRAKRLGASVQITIQDDGPGLPPGWDQRKRGLGITNTRARLDQLYGKEGTLRIESAERQGTLVTLRLPYHLPEAGTG